MLRFIKLIPLFYFAYLCVNFLIESYWEKSYAEQLLLGIPLLFLLIDVMRLIELIIIFVLAKKNTSIHTIKKKMTGRFCSSLNIGIVFMKVEQDGVYFIARKIIIFDYIEPISKIKVFKSLINERHYVADYVFLILLLFRIFLFWFVIFLYNLYGLFPR